MNMNLNQILINNTTVIEKWLHEIVCLNIKLFNTNSGRFLKSMLSLDILEKLVSENGWTKSDNTKVFSFDDADIVRESSELASHNLRIEGIRLSLKSQEASILGKTVRLQKLASESSVLKEYDYLVLYNAVYSNTQSGHLGVFDFNYVAERCEKLNFSYSLRVPKDLNAFSYILTVHKKYDVLSMGCDEVDRLFKSFRNRVCDSISSSV